MKSLILSLIVIPPLLLFHFQPVPTFPMEFVAFLILAMLFAFIALVQSKNIAFPKFGALWILLGLLWLAVGFLNDKGLPVNDRWTFVFWLVGFLSLVCFGSLVRIMGRDRLISIFTIALLTMALIQCLIGFFNHYGVLGELVSWLNYNSARFSGTVAQPNTAAFSLFLGLVSLLFLFLKGKVSWLFSALISFLLAYFSYLTYSRSFYVYFSVFSVFLVLVYLNSRFFSVREFKISSSVLLVFILVPILSMAVGRNLDEGARYLFSTFGIQAQESHVSERIKDFSGASRLCEWSKTLNALPKDGFSVFGDGHGSYSEFSASNTTEENMACSKNLLWNHSHNIAINSLVEWGWVGLLLVLSMAALGAVNAYRNLHDENRIFYLLSFGAFIIYSLLEFPLWNIYFLIVFLLIVSIGSRYWNVEFSTKIIPKLSGFAFLLVLFFGFSHSVNVYLRLSTIFNSNVATEEDLRWLYLYGSDDLWGDRVILTRYFKFLPEPYQYSQQMEEVDAVLSSQRHPVAIVRKGLLHYLSEEKEQYCETRALLFWQYPKYLAQLERDLVDVSSSSVFAVSSDIECT